MKNKYLFVLCMLLAITLASGIFTKAYVDLEDGGEDTETLRVVTSFYPVYIAALNVAGDSETVILENLSEPQTGCMHDYQLTPQDMILLSKADLFLINGGGIEGFLAEVGKAYPDLTVAEATEGLVLLEEGQEEIHQEEIHEEESHEHEAYHEEESHEHEAGESHEGHVHGTENAHGWMDTTLYAGMVENIADALSSADPEHADLYQENARIYCEKIDRLTSQIEDIRQALTEDQTGIQTGNAQEEAQNGNASAGTGLPQINVVIFHEAYAYVARQYGLNVSYCLDLDEERQISASEVADVMHEITDNQVSVILAEELYGKDMGNTVEAETDCQVYYLDSLVRGEYEKDSYLTAMQNNIDIMKAALEEGK